MKAEHRKELHTNYLADRLGKMYQKAGTSNSAIWWGLVLLVALGVAYWWWTARSSRALTAAWTSYWNNRDSVQGAEELAAKQKGTPVEAPAELAQADNLYSDAYNMFFSMPAEARKKFTRASEVYEALAKATSNVDIAVRATLGAAKSQEWLGDLEQARQLYADVAAKYAEHPLAAEARTRAEKLAAGADADVNFYDEWPKRLPDITHGNLKPPPLPVPEK